MYLGRIITKSKTVDTIDFVDITSDKSLVTQNCDIPTLVIGKKNAEEIFGSENIHFLDRKISNNVYWTFAKTERRNEYERDLRDFNNLIISRLNKSIKYKFINIFTESLSTIKDFIKLISSNTFKVVYISNLQLYVYYDNVVYGMSLLDLNYIGIKKNKVIDKLKSNPYNKIVMNDYFLTRTMKKCINNSKILVPYVFFLENA